MYSWTPYLKLATISLAAVIRTYAYNACLVAPSEKAKAMVLRVQREVLTHSESMSLAHYKDFSEKLTLLSRTKGYTDNIEASFLGKNLVNTLSVPSTCLQGMETLFWRVALTVNHECTAQPTKK